MNDQFNSWLDIVVGVPQGSILGPLLFNTFLCDTFLFCNDIDFASYADDNTPYCIGKTPEEVISQLEKSSKSIFEWFENNGLKGNPDKCHLLLSKNDNFEANINENRISNTRFEKLHGVTFDNQLNFNHHIPKFAKQPVINFMHLLEFPTLWMKIKEEYFSIRNFYLNLNTVPSYG